MDRQLLLPWALVWGLFFGGVVGAWGWFHIAPPPRGPGLRLGVATQMSGWRFQPDPLSDVVRSTLATTNLLNGVFTADRGGVVTVFAAEWSVGSARVMSVVEHTPDICWVGAGFVPVDLGQPTQVDLEIGGRSLPFECRAFTGPRGGTPELVLWCTVVDGQVLPEGDRWQAETDATQTRKDRQAEAGRRSALGHFLHNLSDRRAAGGAKQFVRFSVAVTSDWRESLERLRGFSSRWLSNL